ncbi:MAG TPA: YncE family protein [Pyrinomonadaceae bacterium]|nr:YncE family protein [Pyrinomonadaceae bacterium]
MNQPKQSMSDRKEGSLISSSSRWFLPIIGMALFVLACSAQQGQRQSNAASASPLSAATKTDGDSGAALPANLPLRTVSDVPLTGGTTRLDYQSLDSENGRLYIAHLGSDLMTVFDVNKQTIVGDVKDLRRVHGVLAVPELHRIYASATGTNELAVVDDQTLQIVARVPAGDYPDGVAYASKVNKIYVSDLHGKTDTVIDAKTNQVVTTIALGGGAGNTQYDSVSEHIVVTVHGQNELAEIDPTKDQVIGHYPLPGCSGSHGLNIDSEHRLAFVACEENAKLAVFDLDSKKMTAIQSVGADPDVLAFDKAFARLYVSAESGIISIFDERGKSLVKIGEGFFAANAHSVAVDSRTHRVYFPLQNVGGKPVLRIARPSDK